MVLPAPFSSAPEHRTHLDLDAKFAGTYFSTTYYLGRTIPRSFVAFKNTRIGGMALAVIPSRLNHEVAHRNLQHSYVQIAPLTVPLNKMMSEVEKAYELFEMVLWFYNSEESAQGGCWGRNKMIGGRAFSPSYVQVWYLLTGLSSVKTLGDKSESSTANLFHSLASFLAHCYSSLVLFFHSPVKECAGVMIMMMMMISSNTHSVGLPEKQLVVYLSKLICYIWEPVPRILPIRQQTRC